MGKICTDLYLHQVMATLQRCYLAFAAAIFCWTFLGKQPMYPQIQKTEMELGLELPILYYWDRALTNDDSPNNTSVVRLSHTPLWELAGTGELRMNTQDIYLLLKSCVSTKDS